MKYTTLFLDLDGTLLDFLKAEKFAVSKILKNNNLPYDDKTIKTYSEINKTFWESFERGEIEKEDIYVGRFNKLLDVLHEKRDAKKMSMDYCFQLSFGYFKIDGAIEILEYLKSKNYKLYATTNGNCLTQFNRIDNSGLKPYFDDVFVSEEAGFQKPDPKYFDYCIDKISEKNKSNILIVGDSQSSDILGGIKSEIDTCWYNPNSEKPRYQSLYEIQKLDEMKSFL